MKTQGLALFTILFSAKKTATGKNSVTDEVLQSHFTHSLQKL